MFCDSQSAIHLAKNQVYHARTKHIDVRYHFVREIIEEDGVLVQKIKNYDNPADMLTKVVTAIKFNHCLDLINIAKYLIASLSAFGGVVVFVKEKFQDGIRIFVKVEICCFLSNMNPTSV